MNERRRLINLRLSDAGLADAEDAVRDAYARWYGSSRMPSNPPAPG
jgi:hypothetical protein